MPAITADTLTLPRVSTPDPTTNRPRMVTSVTTAPRDVEGEGFPVRRAFAGVDLQLLDPFVHMDQMGEVDWGAGEPKGTAWHPHRGFETVTYMIDGEIAHADSHGGGGLISDGDTQWMTAAQGILHIEAPPEAMVRRGGLFHGFQLWVNLPAALKMSAPRYQDIRAGQVALLSSPDGGALLRVIAGTVAGHEGPGVTHTPISIVHATLAAGASLTLPWPTQFNALTYVMNGKGTVGAKDRPIEAGQLAVFAQPAERTIGLGDATGDTLTITAAASQESRSPHMDVLILGGQPIRERIVAYGPFVMNTKAELAQAYEDYRKGRLGVIPADYRLPHGTVRGEA